ncbi:MAG: hypothetical protein JSS72_07775 [Armatimonadetes bacterium]|nr:hypothetical protein [Armatimonadota bacterium]
MIFGFIGLLATAFSPTIDNIRAQAVAIEPLVKSRLAKEWLAGAKTLPEPTPRTLHRGQALLTQAEYDALDAEAKSKVRNVPVDAAIYYNTKYGTPIAYARAVDLTASFGIKSLKGKKVMDFGYGGIGQLRLFASCGAHAVGVDVDPFLTILYSLPEDTGRYQRGSVQLVNGRFPAEASVTNQVGGGYDLIISKNTLKQGYIHPQRPAKPTDLIDLGVSDEAFLEAVHHALKPGGLLVIYNLCPAQAPLDKPYIPWADGQSPFTKEQFEKAGLEVLAMNTPDDEFARNMAHAFGWDQGAHPMDVAKDLFTWYTVVRRTK